MMCIIVVTLMFIVIGYFSVSMYVSHTDFSHFLIFLLLCSGLICNVAYVDIVKFADVSLC